MVSIVRNTLSLLRQTALMEVMLQSVCRADAVRFWLASISNEQTTIFVSNDVNTAIERVQCPITLSSDSIEAHYHCLYALHR